MPEEVENNAGDFRGVCFEREVPGVEQMHFRLRIVPTERLGTLRKEERIVLAPNSEQRRTVGAEIRLELRVQRDVAGVVEKQVELNLIIAWASQQSAVERIGFGHNQGFVGNAVEILRFGCVWSEEIFQSSAVGWRWVLPVLLNRVPTLAQPFFVGVAVLGNDRRDPLWMCECQAQSDGGAVIEYVDAIAIEADLFSEAIDDSSEVLERVSELLPVGRFWKTEPRKIRRDHVVSIGEG